MIIIYYYVPGIFRGFEKRIAILIFCGLSAQKYSLYSQPPFTEPQSTEFLAIMTSSKLF